MTLLKQDSEADFGIDIQFDTSKGNPSRIFRTLSEMIEAFQGYDENLLLSIGSKIKPVIVLEDLQKGSVKAWFKNVVESIDDEALKDVEWKKIIGAYLVKAKYILINFLKDKTEITTRDQVKKLENDLYSLAKETDIKHLPAYTPIPTIKLLGDIKKITTSVQYLKRGEDKLFFTSKQEEKINFNLEFNYSPEKIEELITKESFPSTNIMIFKVKKPDYLGESMWELRFEKQPIDAKISDEKWLKRFQNREVSVRPGDSIKAKVMTTVKYGYDYEVIGTEYNILEVIEIIKADNSHQIDLL